MAITDCMTDQVGSPFHGDLHAGVKATHEVGELTIQWSVGYNHCLNQLMKVRCV